MLIVIEDLGNSDIICMNRLVTWRVTKVMHFTPKTIDNSLYKTILSCLQHLLLILIHYVEIY